MLRHLTHAAVRAGVTQVTWSFQVHLHFLHCPSFVCVCSALPYLLISQATRPFISMTSEGLAKPSLRRTLFLHFSWSICKMVRAFLRSRLAVRTSAAIWNTHSYVMQISSFLTCWTLISGFLKVSKSCVIGSSLAHQKTSSNFSCQSDEEECERQLHQMFMCMLISYQLFNLSTSTSSTVFNTHTQRLHQHCSSIKDRSKDFSVMVTGCVGKDKWHHRNT